MLPEPEVPLHKNKRLPPENPKLIATKRDGRIPLPAESPSGKRFLSIASISVGCPALHKINLVLWIIFGTENQRGQPVAVKILLAGLSLQDRIQLKRPKFLPALSIRETLFGEPVKYFKKKKTGERVAGLFLKRFLLQVYPPGG
jgi:hypothetical protein